MEVLAMSCSAAEIAGVEDPVLAERLMNDMANCLMPVDGESPAARHARLQQMAQAVRHLGPRDALEAHLIVQMLCVHAIATDLLRQASPRYPVEVRDKALSQSHRFMRLFREQLQTLNKYRGKGGQKVTIEHVTIAAGGQAILGAVGPAER